MPRNIVFKVFSIIAIAALLLSLQSPILLHTVYAQEEEPPASEPPSSETITETPALVEPSETATEDPTEVATDVMTETPVSTDISPLETLTTTPLVAETVVVTDSPLPTESPLLTETPTATETTLPTETAAPICYPLSLKVVDGDATFEIKTPQNCTGGYTAGTLVEINAIIADGFEVKSWQGTIDDSAKTTVNAWLASEAGEIILTLSPLDQNDEYIVNGTEVSPPGKYPWIVAMVNNGASSIFQGQFCAGTLVSSTLVVTAAHCVSGRSASYLDVVAGIHDLEATSGYQRVHVSQIIVHPSYTSGTHDNDIALLLLQSALSIGGSGSSSVGTISLISHNSIDGMDATIAGWGDLGSGYFPTALQEVTVPIYANSVCNDSSHLNGSITSNMFCAGYDSGGYDSCQGDSGGPVIVQDGGWRLAGVVSWGIGCALPMKPGVYTRVYNYTSFIYGYMPLETITAISPSGTITDTTPTYTWTAANNATSYQLLVYDKTAAAYRIDQNISTSACSGGNCSYTPATVLTAGNAHSWKVRPINLAGYGAFTSWVNFTPSMGTLPAVPTVLSPSGTVADTTPTYTWSNVTDATSYQLLVYDKGTSTYRINQTISNSACSGATCSYTSTTVLTSGNAHSWKVQARNAAGSSAYSSWLNFTPSSASVPSAPTGSTPSGTISTLTPTYTWSDVSGATQFQLVVYDQTSAVYVFNQLVSNSVCSGGSCSYTPSAALTNGHTTLWKVRGKNAVGYGTYSAWITITPSIAAVPSAPTGSTPSGTISTLTPTYTWSDVSGATQYQLVVYDQISAVYVVNQLVSNSVCSGGSCSYTPSAALTNGHTTLWKVRGKNAVGYGTYSAWITITPSVAAVPSAPTGSTPSGDISTLMPTYTWSDVSGATQYQLVVYDQTSSVYVVNQLVSNSVCSGGSCSYTPSAALTNGHTIIWKVRGKNSVGYGTYSAWITITPVISGGPAIPVPASPNGNIPSRMATFTWSNVPQATSYRIAVVDLTVSGTTTYDVSSSICSTNQCEYSLGTTLTDGHAYKWTVRSVNSTGSSAYSSYVNFLINGNDDFNTPITVSLSSNQFTHVEDTWSSSKASDDPALSCIPSSQGWNTVWYKFTAPFAGEIQSVSTLNSGYDTVLGIWSGSRGSLTSKRCDDDGNGDRTSVINNEPMTSGQVFYIEVAGYYTYSKGDLHLSLTYH